MGIFSKKTKRPAPFVEVPRGPKGGVGDRTVVLRGSAGGQRKFKKAAKALGLGKPDGTKHRVEVTLDIGTYYESLDKSFQVIWCNVGGHAVGKVPPSDYKRVLKVMEDMTEDVVRAEGTMYQGAHGGWNLRVII